MIILPRSDESKASAPAGYRLISLSPGSTSGVIDTLAIKDIRDDIHTPRTRDLKEVLAKTSHKGRMVSPNHFVFDECIMTEMDPSDGEVVRVESYVKNNSYTYATPPERFINPLDCNPISVPHTGLSMININELDGNIIPNQKIYHSNFVDNILLVEEEFQQPFDETFGTVEIPSTLSALGLPFVVNWIFDSKYGWKDDKLHIPEITKYLSPDGHKKQIQTYYDTMMECYKLFRANCEKNNEHIRMFINSNPSGVVANGYLANHPDIHFTHRINNSDHCRTFMGMESVYRDHYIGSDLFAEMFKNYTTPLASAFHYEDDRERFRRCTETSYYTVTDPCA